MSNQASTLKITGPSGIEGASRTSLFEVPENQLEIYTCTANKPVTWSIIPVGGGESQEADFFEIDSNTGVLKFKSAPDYENPKDLSQIGNYDFYIQAEDNSGNKVTQWVEIVVTDVNESNESTLKITGPSGIEGASRTSLFEVPENQLEIYTCTANKPVTWSIIPVGGGESQEADFFEIDSNTGVLKFKSAPDYENPKDLSQIGNYDFYIQAEDNSGNKVTQWVEIVVTDVNESTIDLIEGTSSADTLFATTEDDEVYGLNGNDVIYGQEGNDSLYGGGGRDSIYGGDGVDIIDGGDGNDEVDGGSGNDVIYGQEGEDILLGNDGVDIIDGGDGNDWIEGGSDNDSLKGEDGDEYIFAGDGNDTIYGGNGNDWLYGGLGDDVIYGQEGEDVLVGEDGVDIIFGGDGNDWFYGGRGNDVIYGQEGDDNLYGHDGVDIIFGGDGYDWLYGESGNDSFKGEDGNDHIYGGNGVDIAHYSGNFNDYSFVEIDSFLKVVDNRVGKYQWTDALSSIEYLTFSDQTKAVLNITTYLGDDSIYGTTEDDIVYGLNGDDVIYGQAGNDSLYGGDGVDIIFGGDGYDLLYGGSGNDSFKGEDGNDFIYGGAGVDIAHYSGNFNDYSFVEIDSFLKVVDNRVGQYQWTDALSSIEFLTFADQTVAASNVTYTTYHGTDDDDLINPITVNNIIYGGDGSDWIEAGDGNDWLYGGSGNDIIYGQEGNDTLSGDDGVDIIFGGEGSDWIEAGDGNDWLYGGSGNDVIYGQEGNDTLYGEDGVDIIFGGDGFDTIYGGLGDDSFKGEGGNDFIYGWDGVDIAHYSGNFNDYSFVETREWLGLGYQTYLKVVDNRVGQYKWTDALSSIEYLAFSDQTVAVSSMGYGLSS